MEMPAYLYSCSFFGEGILEQTPFVSTLSGAIMPVRHWFIFQFVHRSSTGSITLFFEKGITDRQTVFPDSPVLLDARTPVHIFPLSAPSMPFRHPPLPAKAGRASTFTSCFFIAGPVKQGLSSLLKEGLCP